MTIIRYATGEIPEKGDVIGCEKIPLMKEAGFLWIVMSVKDNMVRAKCKEIPQWKQAFFIEEMEKVEFSK